MTKDQIITTIICFSYILEVAIIARVVISWLKLSPRNPLYRIIFAITEPMLGPVRRIVYKSPLGGPGMALDFSPAIVVFLIMALEGVLRSIVDGFF